MIPKRSVIKSALVSLLREKGPTKTSNVYKELAIKLGLTKSDLTFKLPDGRSKFKYEVRWSRKDLVESGVIENHEESGRGIWKLKDSAYARRFPTEYADDIKDKPEYYEGVKQRITVNKYERDANARKACLDLHGYVCAVCEYSLEEIYGSIAKKCIHVHHLIPLSSLNKEYQVDPSKDLIPVCPNCHYIIHRREPPFEISEIKKFIKENK